jgi:AcrR family transcriptional regulator
MPPDELTVCVPGGLAFRGGLRFPPVRTVSLRRRRRPSRRGVTVTQRGGHLWLLFRAMNRSDGEEPPARSTPPSAPRRGEEAPGPGEGAASPPPLGPLPPRHRYTPEQVARHQRERLIAGLAVAVAERGYASLTVGEIAAAAHVSRRVFYEHFQTKEECYLAAFDAVFAHLRAVMATAAEPYADDWPRRVIAALGAALDFFAAEPDLAHLCLIESPAAGPAMQHRFGEVAAIFDPYMAAGRAASESSRPLPESTEVSLIGGLGFKLTRQIAAAGAESLPAQLPAYAEFLLTPYLGAGHARALAAEAGQGRGEGSVRGQGGGS